MWNIHVKLYMKLVPEIQEMSFKEKVYGQTKHQDRSQ